MYDYIDAHMRKFNKMYGKRLRTYKKTGFSVWTGDLQEKQIVHAIFDSGNYTEKFEQDLVEAEKSIVISSPNIRQEKIVSIGKRTSGKWCECYSYYNGAGESSLW